MKLTQLLLPTKQPSTKATPMEEQTAPLNVSRYVDIYPDFTRDCIRVRINAHQLDNGVVTCSVEDILNRTTKQYYRYPYTEELREAVREALQAYFDDTAFARFHVVKTNVDFN